MSKIIIGIVLLIAIAAAGLFVIFSNNQTAGEGEDGTGVENNRGFGGFFPFGDASPVVEEEPRQPSPTRDDGDILSSGDADGLKLQQLSSEPTVGFVATTTPEGLVVRYMDRTFGNIYDVNIDTLQTDRITNTTIPAVTEMFWHKNADTYVLRYADENEVIKTYVGSIIEANSASSTNDEVGELTGAFVDDDISTMTIHPDNTSLLYIDDTAQFGSLVETKFDTDFTNDVQIVDTPFAEWNMQWVNNDTISLTTKPSYIAEGYNYQIDPDIGRLVKTVGGIRGLSTITNASGTLIFYSGYINNNFYTTRIQNLETNIAFDVFLTTLPEKCAWHPNNATMIYCGVPTEAFTSNMPEDWYQGGIGFTDEIWGINSESGLAEQIAAPISLIRERIDVISPSITSNGSHLLFINQADGTLWSLELPGAPAQVVEESES